MQDIAREIIEYSRSNIDARSMDPELYDDLEEKFGLD